MNPDPEKLYSMDKGLLDLRIDGIRQSLHRSRVALVAAIVVSATILTAIWNEYFTWDSIILDHEKLSGATVATLNDVKLQQWLKNYIDNWTISISLLGIRISGSDLSVFGCLALILFSLYWCICTRRTNHEIGSLFYELRNAEEVQRRMAYFGVRADLVFLPTTSDDSEFKNLARRGRTAGIDRVLRVMLYCLPFLPLIAAVTVLLSDVYFAAFYQVAGHRRWDEIPLAYRHRLVWCDSAGFVFSLLIWRFNRLTFRYTRGSATVLDAFRSKYANDFERTIDYNGEDCLKAK